MQVTVIPVDKIISVNGEGLNFAFPAPANLHALQWHGGAGHIEYTDGQANRPLTVADYDAAVAPFVTLWQTEYDRLEEERNRPPTPEELAATAYAVAVSEATTILTARAQRQLVQEADFTGAEFAVFARAGLFPPWTAGETYAPGNRLAHEGIVFEVQQPVTAQGHQPPGSEGMLAVYRPLSVDAEAGHEPDGDRDSPHQWLSGMDVYSGKYYAYEGKLYLARADMIPCVWPPNTPGLWQWELAG